MLSNNITVRGGGGHAEGLREQVAEPGRVEVGAWSDDAVLRQSADLPRDVCQDVHRVARDYKYRVWTIFY